MDDTNIINKLNDVEKTMYENLLHTLELKNLTIENRILIEYIQSHNYENIYITTELLDNIIKECVNIQLKENKIEDSSIKQVPNLGEINVPILSSIINNENSNVPKRILKEEIIYIKGISGDSNMFTNTFLLNKTFNNVESIELVGGFINDSKLGPDGETGDGPQEYVNDAGILVNQDELFGSIGPIPYIWIDIEEPRINTYNHYADLSTQ